MTPWLSIAAPGVGPVGAAFYAWDVGMKRGDIRVLGSRVLHDAAALDLVPDPGRLRQTEREYRHRRGADRRRRPDRGEGHVSEVLRRGHRPSF